jgi:hypothetical protein
MATGTYKAKKSANESIQGETIFQTTPLFAGRPRKRRKEDAPGLKRKPKFSTRIGKHHTEVPQDALPAEKSYELSLLPLENGK